MRKPVVSTPTRIGILVSAVWYLAGKALTILVTIFLAVLITMVIVDVPADVGGGLKMSPFQMRLENQIYWVLDISADQGLIRTDAWGNPNRAEAAALERKLRSSAGLDLPYLQRYLLWTYKALAFNWGELDLDYLSQLDADQSQRNVPQTNIILQHLPNTLLLVGMPFSLYLARH